MWRHTELVYEQSPHKGAVHQVLIYLAGRANEKNHSCYPGNDRIATDLRLDKRTVIRALQTLSKKGDILRITTGSGRGHASTWMLAETYRPKGDMSPPFEAGKGDTPPPISNNKGDMSPSFLIKGDIESLKGDIGAERVTSDPLKGDMSPPQHKRTEEEKKKREEGERAQAREAPALSPDVPTGANSYAARFKTITGAWVGFTQQDYLQERLGPEPDWATLAQVFKAWSTRGNNPRNLNGIFDWYDQALTDPNWEPYQRQTTLTRAKQNGSGPKTFTQLGQENTVAAAQRLMEKYANEQS